MTQLIEPLVIIRNSIVSKQSTWIRCKSHIYSSRIFNNTFIGFRTHIENAIINSYCEIASGAYINGSKTRKVNIDKYCWIGESASISPGVHVAEGTVIGAGSHLNIDTEPYSIYIGSPAKKFKSRVIKNNSKPNFDYLLKNMIKFYKKNPPDIKKIINYTGMFFDENIIGRNSIISGRKSSLFPNGGIKIGNSKIGCDCILEVSGGLVIGNNVNIGNNEKIITTSHDYNYLSLPQTTNSVLIQDNVTIGNNSIIFPGSHLNNYSFVPKNSMFIKNKVVGMGD